MIIAFVGRAGSGKDYQCSLLEKQGYKRLAFADGLRDIAFSSLHIPLEEGLKHYDEMKTNPCIDIKIGDEIKSLNFRQFLEGLGTQAIRRYVPDFWIKCLLNTIEKNNYEKVCISDLRFANEFDAVWSFAQYNNIEFKCIFCDYHSERYQENNPHESAKMANYFASKFKDLDEITKIDIEIYKGELNG